MTAVTLNEDELYLLIEFHRNMQRASTDSNDAVEADYHRGRAELFERLLDAANPSQQH